MRTRSLMNFNKNNILRQHTKRLHEVKMQPDSRRFGATLAKVPPKWFRSGLSCERGPRDPCEHIAQPDLSGMPVQLGAPQSGQNSAAQPSVRQDKMRPHRRDAFEALHGNRFREHADQPPTPYAILKDRLEHRAPGNPAEIIPFWWEPKVPRIDPVFGLHPRAELVFGEIRERHHSAMQAERDFIRRDRDALGAWKPTKENRFPDVRWRGAMPRRCLARRVCPLQRFLPARTRNVAMSMPCCVPEAISFSSGLSPMLPIWQLRTRCVCRSSRNPSKTCAAVTAKGPRPQSRKNIDPCRGSRRVSGRCWWCSDSTTEPDHVQREPALGAKIPGQEFC